MRNGTYKSFYLSNEQRVEVDDILKECQELTLKQINKLYPGTRKVIISIAEKDILILALKKYLKELQSK